MKRRALLAELSCERVAQHQSGMSEAQCNACLPIGCRARLLHSHFIGADSKLLRSKEAPLIGCCRSR